MTEGSGRRIAVFDAYWSTAGGGEAYAAGVADVLSRSNAVTLLAHEPVDTEWLGERLGADLSRVAVEVIDPTAPLERSSAGFDLLVNLSYRDHGRNGARHGIYVVHFPDEPGADMAAWQRRLTAVGSRLPRPRAAFEVLRGFHQPDVIRWQQVRWTDGRGVLRVEPEAGRTEVLTLWFGRYVPAGRTRHIGVVVDGERLVRAELGAPRSKFEVLEPLRVQVPVTARPGGVVVELHSESSVAHDDLGNGDRRCLGVPLVGATLGSSWSNAIAGRASLLFADRPGTAWLDSYDAIVANSAFTQRWIERWWRRPSKVIEPPVRLRAPGPKDQVILSVGRFFAPGRGHAKKQLELVHAFASLLGTGRVSGWELHLVGGCDPIDQAYLDEVRRAARGLPVEFHVDASGAELDALYRRAAIYWHATGLGEDIEADPVRAEHFGITTVEAMSAGAVPVVMAAGGQVDIVRVGVDGCVFADLDGLVRATVDLVTDDDLRHDLASAAVERAQQFGFEAFSARCVKLVEQVCSGVEGQGAPGG